MRFAASRLRRPGRPTIDPAAILNAIADPVMVVDADGRIDSVNMAAEQFWQASAATLQGQSLSEILPGDSPIFALIEQVRNAQHSVTEYGVTIATPKIGLRQVAIDVAAIPEAPGAIVISIQDRSIARRLDQLQHRSASRSLTAMAAMLAHEVKNPLSGIRGAAQLLEQNAADADRELTRLICDESDRIVALVDRMETFGDERPLDREAVNIHEVLDHVRRLARSGFARNLRIVESYDPSLPPVFGNRDLLIQALLNLMKNAAEAVPSEDGEIQLSTRFMQGMRLSVPGSGSRVDLPLAVSVIDNGPGIPEDIQPYLFDPFVSTKANGSGLGLALVAKVIADHGGVIEFESAPRRTVFRLMLPMAPADRDRAEEAS